MFHFSQARQLSDFAVKSLGSYSRRTLDHISARIYFYYSWIYESMGRLSEIRSILLMRMQTAVLQHDEVGQETLLNLLLRNYLHYNLYDQVSDVIFCRGFTLLKVNFCRIFKQEVCGNRGIRQTTMLRTASSSNIFDFFLNTLHFIEKHEPHIYDSLECEYSNIN